jgi:hypothetical protein
MNSDFNHQISHLRIDERNHVEKPLLYQTEDGQVRLDVRLQDETV